MRVNDIKVAQASDSVTAAARAAIQRARNRGDQEASPDDLLAGALLTVSRFGIVWIGEAAIDLEALNLASMDRLRGPTGKVAYSAAAAAVFDRAAGIARREGAPRVEAIHLLAAFAGESGGLMGRLKSLYGLDDTDWRAGLARWPRGGRNGTSVEGAEDAARANAAEFLSPEGVAEFLGLHIQTVRGYIRSGKLPALRVAGERAIRIRREDVLALLEPLEPSGGDDD